MVLAVVVALPSRLLKFPIVPEPTARSEGGLLIPYGYLHPDKSEHGEVLRSAKSIKNRGRVTMFHAWHTSDEWETCIKRKGDCFVSSFLGFLILICSFKRQHADIHFNLELCPQLGTYVFHDTSTGFITNFTCMVAFFPQKRAQKQVCFFFCIIFRAFRMNRK